MLKTKKVLFLRLIIVLFSVVIFILICIYFIELVRSVNYRIYDTEGGLSTHTVSSENITYSDWSATFYLSEIKPTTDDIQKDFLDVDLLRVNLPTESYQSETFDPSFCLNELTFQTINKYIENPIVSISSTARNTWNFTEVCSFNPRTGTSFYSPGDLYYLKKGVDSSNPLSNSISSNVIRTSTMYPFDEVEVSFLVEMNVTERLENNSLQQKDIAPLLRVYVNAPNWQPTAQFSQGQDYTFAQIRFTRPIAYRIITIVIFGIIFFAIGLIFFLKDSGGVMEISIGILFSLWGIKSSLLPEFLSSAFTLIDGLVWASYIFLAYILMNRFLLKPLFINLGKNTPSDEFPQHANITELSRCAKRIENLDVLAQWILQESNTKNRKGALTVLQSRIKQIEYLKNRNA